MSSNFKNEIEERVSGWVEDGPMQELAFDFLKTSASAKYPYNFFWLGRPIIQYPQDIVATQELIWAVKPDLIIETGIAHGGSLILSASILSLIEQSEALQAGRLLDPSSPRRKVIGVDIDIRQHNREAIEAHPLSPYITMVEGSSINQAVIDEVSAMAKPFERIMVFLDSNHTHDHVLEELRAYAPLVGVGSYCVDFDTLIEDMGEGFYQDRTWGPGNSPKSALHAYLAETDDFVIDKQMHQKLMITVASDGFLRRVS